MLRSAHGDPRGALSDDDLAAEDISGMQWLRIEDITGHDGTDLFSPRDLATHLAALIAGNITENPLALGL